MKWVETYYGKKVAGMVIEGKTGETVFFPATGYYTNVWNDYKWENDGIGQNGHYWCSGTALDNWSGKYYGHCFNVSNFNGGFFDASNKWSKEWLFSVRPIRR